TKASMKILIVGFIFLFTLIGYFYFSPSYSLSRAAQKAYEAKDYHNAYELSSEALKKDPYNKSAFQVFSQSRQRINIQQFLQNTIKNHQRVLKILKNPTITAEEFLELQWIYDEFMEVYSNLLLYNYPTPKERQEITRYVEWFEVLKQRLMEVK
ncbi:MAG: hypothetical protein K2I63_02330, partial [Helicobacter sp.]|nr:hypothetical protein [Helicobacter sp.]